MRKGIGTLLIILLLLCSLQAFAQETEIMLSQDKEYVTVIGKATENTLINMTVLTPAGKISYMNDCISEADGSFQFLYPLADKESGVYTVKISKAGMVLQTKTFQYEALAGNQMLSFGINGQPGEFNGNAITVTFSEAVDKTKLKAHFSASDKAEVTVNSITQVSNVTENDFTSPVTYVVTSQSGEAKSYVVNVEVNKKNNGSGGGSGGSGGTGGSGGGIKAEAVNPAKDENQKKEYFSDLTGFEWAKGYIEFLAEKNIVNGVGDEKFMPEKNVTREEFVKMIMEAFQFEVSDMKAEFEDVGQSQWYSKYIASAGKLGIINGTDEKNFGVGEFISRQDMALIAFRSARLAGKTLPEGQEATAFRDHDTIAAYAREAVTGMQSAGIINGITETEFAPTAFANRAQACKIIAKLYQY